MQTTIIEHYLLNDRDLYGGIDYDRLVLSIPEKSLVFVTDGQWNSLQKIDGIFVLTVCRHGEITSARGRYINGDDSFPFNDIPNFMAILAEIRSRCTQITDEQMRKLFTTWKLYS